MGVRGCNVLVMGVSGVGKTTVARALADAIGGRYLEADQYHSPENVRSMQAGVPLTDAMRERWLASLCDAVERLKSEADTPVVMACSALKRRHRSQLAKAMAPHLVVHLTGAPDLIRSRMTARQGHFMPATLLESQLNDLERPSREEGAADNWTVIEIDIEQDPDTVLSCAMSAYRRAVAHAGNTQTGAP